MVRRPRHEAERLVELCRAAQRAAGGPLQLADNDGPFRPSACPSIFPSLYPLLLSGARFLHALPAHRPEQRGGVRTQRRAYAPRGAIEVILAGPRSSHRSTASIAYCPVKSYPSHPRSRDISGKAVPGLRELETTRDFWIWSPHCSQMRANLCVHAPRRYGHALIKVRSGRRWMSRRDRLRSRPGRTRCLGAGACAGSRR